MISAGQEMMKSVKSNLSQKRSKTRYFDRKLATENPELNLDKAPTLSKEELAAFSRDFKKKQRQWSIRVWGISLLAGGILFMIIALIVS